MDTSTKVGIGVAAAAVVVIGGAVIYLNGKKKATASTLAAGGAQPNYGQPVTQAPATPAQADSLKPAPGGGLPPGMFDPGKPKEDRTAADAGNVVMAVVDPLGVANLFGFKGF